MRTILLASALVTFVVFFRSPYGASTRDLMADLPQLTLGLIGGLAALALCGTTTAIRPLAAGGVSTVPVIVCVVVGIIGGILTGVLWTTLGSPSTRPLGSAPANLPTLEPASDEASVGSRFDDLPWSKRVLVRAGVALAVLVAGLVVVSETGLLLNGVLLIIVRTGLTLRKGKVDGLR